MDYQKAIELLKGEIKCSCYRNRGYCGICTIYSELDRDKIIDACKCAISAMQELDGYKKKLREVYGECEVLLENLIDGHVKYQKKLEMKTPFKSRLLTDEDVDLWEEYKKLGTLEEVREAMKEFQIIKSADEDLEYYIQELKEAKYDIDTFWEEPTELSKAMGMAIRALIKNQEYKQLGTLGEVQKAIEKQKEKIPTYDGDGYAPDGTFVWDEWICPNCGTRYEVDYDDYDYCPNCGQHIDWRKWSEEE